MKIYFGILFALLFALPFASAQKLYTRQASLPCIDKVFQITAHVTRDSLGDFGVTEQDIRNGIDTLNKYFSPICISFNLCEINYIDNFQYNSPANENEWAEMKVKYVRENRINIFFVAGLSWMPYDCGLGDFEGLLTPAERPAIMVFNGCLLSGAKALPHHVGHFFGLNDTNLEEGAELVDGTNCTTNGDLICDTPADPYVVGENISNYVDVQMGCRFIYGGTDANGESYLTDVGNIMSYYPEECKCGFSYEQYQLMAENYRKADPKHW